MNPLKFAVVLIALALFAANARAEDNGLSDFHESGVLVGLPGFFLAVENVTETDPPPDGVSGMALVTESGVYAFLETPGNAASLENLEAGQAVRIKGRQYAPGRLLQIESLERLNRNPVHDLKKIARDSGRQVSLEGSNKCQCGLEVGALPTSCDLGHLHHLEASDGKLYHYLQTGPAVDMFLGNGYHFKKVKVRALELPGQFLLVESAEVEL